MEVNVPRMKLINLRKMNDLFMANFVISRDNLSILMESDYFLSWFYSTNKKFDSWG